jgi:hypothetical protein
VGAALSESLAQIEDDYANDMGSAHSLDAVSMGNWVDGTYDNRGPKGDNTTPFVTSPSTSQPASGPDLTNVTEPVMINVDPCTRPSNISGMAASGRAHLLSAARVFGKPLPESRNLRASRKRRSGFSSLRGR